MLKKIISSILIIIILTLWMPVQELIEVFSSYAENNTWNYAYTGNMQEFEAPYNGKYKIEVWGAQGGSSAVAGGLGGYSYVETILLEGEKLYIACGGQGKNVGEGGYNGGGSSTQGASGGGATHVSYTTGLLKDLSSQKDQLLVVAGGGGGSYHSVLPNQDTWWKKWEDGNYTIIEKKTDAFLFPGNGGGTIGANAFFPNEESEHCEVLQTAIEGGTQTSGYKFGEGQDGNAGGGGGLYGGYAGNNHYLSGAGGSGYLIETEFKSDSENGKNSGNGRASITYEGEVERTITIDTKECGTYEEKTGTITRKAKVGDSITLSDIVPKNGYQFLGYVDYKGNIFPKSFTVKKENIRIKASFYAPLIIQKEKDGVQSIRINIRQDDEFEKYYKVLQSKDGKTWYDAALSSSAKDGIPEGNKQYSPGSYTYVAPITGKYKIRLSGAEGSTATDSGKTARGGKGAYTEGTITLERGTRIYIFVGKQAGGGEATDIRVNSNTMANRIMVAAGGGGGAIYYDYTLGNTAKRAMPGTDGGALTSNAGTIVFNDKDHRAKCWATAATGATQTSGGKSTYVSQCNYGNQDYHYKNGGQSSYAFELGGGGYWQGARGGSCNCIGNGTGGSSYISGYSGCTRHSSGYVFTDTNMIAGNRAGVGIAYINLLTDTNVYGNSMNNIIFYDTAKPNKPSDAEISQKDDKLTITWKDNGDNGTKYYHKVESYNKATNQKINTSNILDDYLETGVVGWYYKINANPTYTVTSNDILTDNSTIEITSSNTKTYLHVAAVDGAGNISDTYNYEIPSNVNYTVHYNGNGETKGETEDSSHNYNEAKDLTINKFEKKYIVTYNHNYKESNNISKEANYTFKNWNTKIDGTGASYRNEEEVMNLASKNGETVNLYAQWDSASITYVPEREGYTFVGWYQESTGANRVTGEDGIYTPTEDITLYAKWEINTSTLTVNPNEGSWNNDTKEQSFTQDYNTEKNIPNPEREGYTFIGWERSNQYGSLSSAVNGSTYTFGATNNVTDIITAKWMINRYRLEVRPNEGVWKETEESESSAENQTFTIDYKGEKIIPVPSRNGYSFTKWVLAGEGSKMSSLTANNATFTMGYMDATLTANWQRNDYELEIRPNGGKWKESIESEEREENQRFSIVYEGTKQILLPSRNGYTFIGWTLEGKETGSTMSSLVEDATFTMGYGNATLIANWKLITKDITTGSITWNDKEDKYSSRPSEVEVTLNSDEEDIEKEEGALKTPTTKTVTCETYSFENLQTKKIKDNTDYQYRVSQNKVLGYETLINGYDITNNLILPNYTSEVITTAQNNVENEFIKNEEVQIIGVIKASENNRNKVGLGKEEVTFQIDRGIQISEDSIKITYIDKEGKTKEITNFEVENNILKVAFESNREKDNTAGDSLKIEVKGNMQEVKEYTNTISYAGYLRDYETGEETTIDLGTVTSATETITAEKVSIAMKEINEEDEITRGSHFEIRRKDTGEVIQSIITEGKEEIVRKLEPMVEYVVVETKPIEGYTTAEEVIFMLDEQGEIVIQNEAEKEENTIVIRDYKTRLQIEIKDELTKEYVVGPTWQVIRKTEENGQMLEEVMTEWTSEGKEKQIEKLPIGEYTLREVAIGESTGYVTIKEVAFKIEDTKELQVLEVKQQVSKVRIHLRDIETEAYVEGAVLQIIQRNEKNGKIEEKLVREWTTGQEGELEQALPVGEYIIREISLPENSGYTTIEEKTIKVMDTLEEQQVELRQDFTKIKIEIVDEETKEKIDNVEVEIIEKETGKVIKLEETEEGYVAKKVPIGDYIIREKTPDGYKEIQDIEMKVEDIAGIQTIKTENKRLIYDMQVEKELTSITIDGEKELVAKGNMQKIEIQSSKIKTADIRLEYVIRVNNVGETKATIGKIIDNIPEGFKLVSTDWIQEGNKAIYNAEKEELQPGESKEVRIILKWENKESNFGEKKNTAQLQESTNPYGYEDKTADNNIGEEITIFSIKTGFEKAIIVQIIAIILLTSIIICLVIKIEMIILKRR